MPKEHLLEIQITQPGRVTGQYRPVDVDTLRLEKIIRPVECLPFDVGLLPTALTSFDEPFSVLVLGELSHPANTEVESRLLGAVQRAEEAPFLLVAATIDESAPASLERLTADQCAAILATLNHARPGEWHWLSAQEVEPILHSATLRYRNKKTENRLPQLDPAWKPLHLGRPAPGFTDIERYTPAEYTFFELPHRFQHYVRESLAPDERILYASRRPAISSQRNRSWLRREGLQEGVLILTTQRLIHLVELVPPDSTNIRYGFHTTVGALERLAGVTLASAGSNLLLQTDWQAKGGRTVIEWESPNYTRVSLEELVSLLKKFQTDVDVCALRRAALPAPPETLPPLTDTASNNPEDLLLVNKHFSNVLAESLSPGEQARAWALLPEWFQTQAGAQALVVTERRIFMLPNHSLDIPFGQVATLEYTSSILESALALNSIQNGSTQRSVIIFPYPAQCFFRDCFEAARRCIAVLPLV
ncbi:MAG: hypothetical protein JW963_19735 [Anaerolineales bacterium]|nr:hypothetical protein [Anaerolineales bacterium]